MSESIVAFHTFSTTYLLYRNAVHFLVFQILMELLIDAVELVISELHLRFPVTVDTPSHAEISILIHFTHLLDLAMTGLAGLLAYGHVL